MPPEGLIRCLHLANAASDSVPDAELLRRNAGGTDDTAFELLVRRHAEMVWRVCRAVSRDHHAAEDAFQATFLALSRKAAVIRDSVAGWLYRVAHHTALKARARGSHAELLDTLDRESPASAEPSAAVESAELAAVVHDELGRLAEKYRLPLVLCDLEGYTHAAAARSLGWPVGTVATRVARGRTALRERLTRRGVALSASGVTAAFTAPPASALPPLLTAATVRAIGTNAIPPTIHTLAREAISAMTRTTKKIIILTAVAVVALTGATAVTFASKPDPSETTEKAPPEPPKIPEDGAPLSAVIVAQGPAGPRVVTVRSADRIAALEKFFPDYRKRPASFNKGGWEACYEIYFNFPRGNTVRLTASDERNDPPAWSAGMGDFLLSREFYKLVATSNDAGAAGPGNWSTEVRGLKGRLILEHGAPSNGTPIIRAYVELHNVSGSANPIELPLGSAKWAWAVTDRDGNDVKHTSLPGNELAGPPPRLVIPDGATLRLVVSKTASGIPKDKAAHLDLGLERTWVFDRGDRKEYYLGGKLEVRDNRFGLWEGTIDLPKVRIPTSSP